MARLVFRMFKLCVAVPLLVKNPNTFGINDLLCIQFHIITTSYNDLHFCVLENIFPIVCDSKNSIVLENIFPIVCDSKNSIKNRYPSLSLYITSIDVQPIIIHAYMYLKPSNINDRMITNLLNKRH